MIALTLAEVAEIVGGSVADGRAQGRVLTSVVTDSRDVRPGTLFVALGGEHVDGHDYLAAAERAGAAAALVSRDVPQPPLPTILVDDAALALAALAREVLARLRAQGDLVVVAITGSVGKTTTKDLLSQVLAPVGPVVAPVASFNNEIGLPLTVLRADDSTRVLVLEMGADAPGNLTYLTSIAPPDIAVVLVVGRAHLGGFGSIEGVARTKAELVKGLAPGGVAILNADDARVIAMASHSQKVLRYGTGPDAQVRAEHVVLDDDGRLHFDLVSDCGRAAVHLGIRGAHQVTNALAVASVALQLGRPLSATAAALGVATIASPHRMHVTDLGTGVRVIDDAYNANPDSMAAALRALAAIAGTRRRSVAVLGEMLELGGDSVAEHRAVGELVSALGVAELVVVGEGARPVLVAALAEGVSARLVPTVAAAHELLSELLQPGDVVLVKSSMAAGLAALGDALAHERPL